MLNANGCSPADGETLYTDAIEQFTAAGYVDSWKAIHPDDFVETKIARSQTGARIDYILLSADLAPTLDDAGIETNVVYPDNSDHRPIWVDLTFPP